jgi:hypothetical protein
MKDRYYKYDGHKGLRFFKLQGSLEFPESEKCIQVCVSSGEVKKGRMACIGIYITRKTTMQNNYQFMSAMQECTKKEFEAAKKKVLKLL